MKMRLALEIVGLLAAGALAAGRPAIAADAPTPSTLRAALADHPSGDGAVQLASAIRTWFGAGPLLKGPNPKVHELEVAWAIEAPGASAAPWVISDDASYHLTLQRVGDTDVYAASTVLPEGAGMKWHYDVGGARLGSSNLEVYTTPADDLVQPGVPKGIVTQQPAVPF